MSTRKVTTVALLSAVLATGCGSETTAPSAPPPSPSAATEVLSVTPEGGTTNIGLGGPFVLRFSGAMMSGMEQYVDLHRGDVSGPTQPMTCTWSADSATLTCAPATSLEPGTWHTLHVGGGMMGADGAPIQMEPGDWMGEWTQPGAPRGPGMMDGPMTGQSHGGEPWTMMGSGWRHANGTYGMVLRFQTR